jgi:transcriptional regulator with GAF, ATPase, and Fis domain
VRELENVIERAVIVSTDGRLDLDRALPQGAPAPRQAAGQDDPAGAAPPRILTATELDEMERANIVRALDASGGKVSGPGGAAELLAMPPSTLSSRIKALGLKKR